MCHMISRNGRPMWDCWSDEIVHFHTLSMMQFVEVDDKELCDKCDRISKQRAASPSCAAIPEAATESFPKVIQEVKPTTIPMVRIIYPGN
jgi:hypothetical protein